MAATKALCDAACKRGAGSLSAPLHIRPIADGGLFMAEVAIVTGAGRGLGLAIAEALLGAGFAVARVSMEKQPQAMRAAVGGRHRYYRYDVSDIDGHARLIARIAADLGEPSCLVNNAGVTSLQRGDVLALTPESYDRVLAVNLRASFFLTQAFARRLIAAPQRPPRASIVFMGSANAEIVGENRADYCISKAGVAMMSKVFAARLAQENIQVFEIRPGIVLTDMTRPAAQRYDTLLAGGGIPMGRWGEPEEIGRAVVSLATGAIPYATGIHLDLGGGMQLHRV
jgi:NAD(P)-dependent dehydrogenase (short-subunit alcohol dehydrogenase family)